MAKAYKCDRCGKYYDKNFPVEDMSVVHRFGYTNEKAYHLCGDCGDRLVEFMNPGMEERRHDAE